MKVSADVEKIIGRSQGTGLAAAFRQNSEQVRNAIDKALLEGALMVERDAKKLTPVDTGRLRASITHRLVNAGTQNVETHVGTNVEYAPFVEFGRANDAVVEDGGGVHVTAARGKPFLFPAYRMNKEQIIRKVTQAVQAVLGR